MKLVLMLAIFSLPLLAAERKAVKTEEAAYPDKACKAKITGSVNIGFTISPEGEVKDVVISSASSDEALKEAATANIKEWRFNAAQGEDKGRILYLFQLRGKAEKMSYDEKNAMVIVVGSSCQ